VETFFLEALEEVRRYIINRRQKQYRRAVVEYNLRVREASRNQTKFPKIRDISALDPGPPSSLPTNPDTKVDISSLTWEDKERVLRLLFAKINNVQGYVDTTPEHPLEAASAAAFPPSVHGSAASQSDNDDARSSQDARRSNNKSPTFVTQAGRAAAANRLTLENLTEREIGGAAGGAAAGGSLVVIGGGSSGGSSARGKGVVNGRGYLSPASPVLVGVPHEPQAPSVV
ncbi:unnamed protein product, partial [Ectocarpus fasciculatus]